jgi:SAM-dependent methyltransferase
MERALIVRAVRSATRGSVVADLPCGTGRLAEPLLEAGFKVIGYDISQDMLDVAHGRLERFGKNFRSEVADAFSPAAPQEIADVVLCARVLMHFPFEEQVKFVGGVRKFGKGPIVITQCYSSPYQRLRRGLKKILGHQPSANYPITESQIAELLERNGLREHARFRLNRFVSEAIFLVVVPK